MLASRSGSPRAGGSVPPWEPELRPLVPPRAGGRSGDIRDAALGLSPQSPLAAPRHRYRQRLMRCQCTTRSYFGNTLALLILPAVTAGRLIRFLRLCLLFIKLSKASACRAAPARGRAAQCPAPHKKPIPSKLGAGRGTHGCPRLGAGVPSSSSSSRPPRDIPTTPGESRRWGRGQLLCQVPPCPLAPADGPLPCPHRSPPA